MSNMHIFVPNESHRVLLFVNMKVVHVEIQFCLTSLL